MSKRKKQPKKPKQCNSQAGEQSFEITLTFGAPFISQASGVMALGLDASMQRDIKGIPVINGSLIRGNIRHALTEFQEALDDQRLKSYINSWFGDESKKGDYTPKRANVDFDFYWKLNPEAAINTDAKRTRIAIDDKKGTVKSGALQVIEDCFPTGSDNPVFKGKVTLRYKLGNEPKNFEKWFKKALEYIPAMGSFKGVGFGKLIDADVNKAIASSLSQDNLSLPQDTTRFGMLLTLDRPFCIGRPITPDSNKIVSDEYIAGNVIKGVIARSYNNKSEELKSELCFDDLIITHALPALNTDNPQRTNPLSLSLAIQKQNGKDIIIDMTDDAFQENEEALKFQLDWKPQDFATVNTSQERKEANLKRIVSLKTGIERETGISEENKLFSLECIDNSEHIWCADIDLINIPEKNRRQVFQKLQILLRKGLNGIGKTKAKAQIKLRKEPFNQTVNEKINIDTKIGSSYKVQLISSARLLPPNLEVKGTNSNTDLEEKYKDYWKQVHPDIELETYFAQQTLTSTYYHTQARQNTEQYYPEWLTNAGSVFVVKATTKEALDRITQLQQTGLPAHKNINNELPNWEDTPYLAEQGYGEVMLKHQEKSND